MAPEQSSNDAKSDDSSAPGRDASSPEADASRESNSNAQPSKGEGSGRSRDRRDTTSIRAASGDALAHGITIAVSIALFMWVGDRLDRWLGSGPFLALLGMLLGAAAGFWRLYVQMVVLPRRDAESRSGEGRKGT